MLLDQVALLFAGGGILLGAFLIARLLRRPRPLSSPDRMLGLLIAGCALNAGHPALSKLFAMQARALGQFFEPLEFLLPPLLAAYAVAAVRGEFRLRPLHLLHVVASLAAATVSLWFTLHGRVPNTVSVVMWAALSLQMVAYLGPALRLLHRYQNSLVDRVSNLAPVDLGWLRRFFWLAAGLCLVSLTVLILLLHDLTPATLGAGTSFALTVAVWVLGSRGLEQKFPASEGPEPSDASEGLSVAAAPIASASAKPLLAPTDARRIRTALEEIFVTKRPHRDPDLGLSGLAQLVGAPRNQVSFVINNEMGVNFYDLVNSWRVKEFRALAADPRRVDDKILTLALEAGFNSKPTFNKVVLKMTGKTPTQIRQEEIESRRSR